MRCCNDERDDEHEVAMGYSYNRAAAWIVTAFTGQLRVADLNTLKKMIAADLLYAYEQGKKDSAGIVRQDQT
jgi:hypothetical protein